MMTLVIERQAIDFMCAIGMGYLSSGFYRVSRARALGLCKQYGNGRALPKHGMEQCIAREHIHYWIARTTHNGRIVWSIRLGANHHLSGGYYRV